MCLIVAVLSWAACDRATPVIESTTVLESTADHIGPYGVQSVVIGVEGENIELNYAIDGGLYIPLPMRGTDGTEVFQAAIPGQAAGTRVEYYVSILRDGVRLTTDPEGAGALPYHFDILP